MRKFVISLKMWHRGRGSTGSALRRLADRKQCCLGFYLRACGLKVKDIEARTMPYRVVALPDEAKWLGQNTNTDAANELARINDVRGMSETERKKQIKQEFAKHDVRVTFK